MAKSRKIWIFSPSKQVKPKLPNALRAKVTAEANELIETVLKTTHVESPAGDERFNYIVDIYSKWYRNYFYFCSKYACPGPNAISPHFEAGFARLEYVGNERFNLAYMRHTEKWWEIYTELSLGECMDAIRDEPLFLP
ncbi:MAG: hypothetical protein ACE5NG_17490 [bacterium]